MFKWRYIYQGKFFNDQFIKGIKTYPDGTQADGEWWSETEKFRGKVTFLDGTKLNGEFSETSILKKESLICKYNIYFFS